jgi:hypothetical protein
VPKEKRNISQELLNAYLTTKYLVHTPKGETIILIGKRHPEIDPFVENLELKSWAYITAYNPHSELLPKEANQQRQGDLKKTIQDTGLSYFEGEGIGTDETWEPEPSVFIPGITEDVAIRLGEKYGQNAIVFGKYREAAQLLEC